MTAAYGLKTVGEELGWRVAAAPETGRLGGWPRGRSLCARPRIWRIEKRMAGPGADRV